MKNKILLFSFLFFSLSASAQYFEVGMTWVYGQYTTMPGWPPHISTMTITGDTMINGEAAFIIDPPEPSYSGNPRIRYIGESGQQVFYYMNDEKRLLYDFSLNVGDTLVVKAQWCCQGDLLDTIVGYVDSVGSITVSGVPLKYQDFGSADWPREHVEGVGSLYYFFPNPPLFDNAYSKLRCVIYPNGDILKFTDDEDCYTIMGVNDIQQSGLAMYPNPVMDELTIENKEGKAYTLRFFNQQGQLLFHTAKSYTGQKINTTNWPPGAYWVELVVDKETFTQVIVKE